MKFNKHGCEVRFPEDAWLRFVLAGILCSVSQALHSGPLAMVTDNGGDVLSVIDSGIDAIALTIAGRRTDHVVGDCAISSDETVGIASNSSGLITFVDLSAPWSQEMRLTSGSPVQRITISNLGVDLALSPDDRLLIAAGGGALRQPVSVIDVAQRREVSTSTPFWDHTSIDYCDDGTLLITTSHGEHFDSRMDNALYDGRLRADFGIELLGGRISSGAQPNNATCAPGAGAGVLLDRAGEVISFTLPGLQAADRERTAGEFGISASFSPDGRRLYVRTVSTVEAFDFQPATGAIRPDWSIQIGPSTTYYGIEQIAVHPRGDRIYVDGGDDLHVLRAADGIRVGRIEGRDATGVCFARLPGEPYPSATFALAGKR